MKMSKTEAKEIARDIIAESIGIAYYKIADDEDDYSDDEKDLIIDYINKLGERACKAIKSKYITY